MNNIINYKQKLQNEYNLKIFTDNIEYECLEQIELLLQQDMFKDCKIRIMPDCHSGKGCVIGFTANLEDKVIPNIVGVDIGCGLYCVSLGKISLNFQWLDEGIRKEVPSGRESFNEIRTKFKKIQELICYRELKNHKEFERQIGTLGGGNHFIEVGESLQEGAHYLTLHSGSRNFGLKVCNYHANKMKVRNFFSQEYQDEFECITKNTNPRSDIPAKLAELNARYEENKKEYFLQGEDMYEYLVDMVIAQTYAQFNHRVMAHDIFVELRDVEVIESIHSMHNFIDTRDWIIRKGAIRAYRGEKMVIPFNMRDGLLICEGKSNVGWNCSAPHGAGRILARSQAFKTLKMEEFEKEMKGIYSTSVCPSTLDESPMAYKDKDIIINAIGDTALIQDTVKPILNIKAKA